MNTVLEKLKGGSLVSDGRADEVAQQVLGESILLPLLIEGLDSDDDVVRVRSAVALEHISRFQPDLLAEYIPFFLRCCARDPAPMVKGHLAGILGNSAVSASEAEKVVIPLFDLLDSMESAPIKSRAITCLVIIGRRFPSMRNDILNRISTCAHEGSISVKVKLSKATALLKNTKLRIPTGWMKNPARECVTHRCTRQTR
jgi:hypothetical protein